MTLGEGRHEKKFSATDVALILQTIRGEAELQGTWEATTREYRRQIHMAVKTLLES